MLALGIETSCDETAAAIVRDDRTVLADQVLSQLEDHAPYGGVVPEIAARAHLDHLDRLIVAALNQAKLTFDQLDLVAATAGPGLIGGLMVGVTTAKALAATHGKPFLAINHLEGHALTPRLTNQVEFPYVLLLVSGGHCQLLIAKGVGNYERLGSTIDDAVGEAFDKTAKMLGLGYPGGPAVEQAARDGDPKRFALPRPLKGRDNCDFSFSGLKTAVRHAINALPDGKLSTQDVADMCASFQAAVGDVIADRCTNALERFRRRNEDSATLVVAGGVAANSELRHRLTALCKAQHAEIVIPPPRLCTDNAAMIAWAGIERHRLGIVDGLDFAPRPRWPLTDLSELKPAP